MPDIEQLPTVTLTEPAAQEAAMLNNVLTASVVKIQEYPITLPIVLQLVESQNLPVANDRFSVKLRGNDFYLSLSDFLPDVSATYVQSRFQGVIQIFGNQTVNIYQTRYTPELNAQWTLYPGGRDVFNSLAARRRLQASRLNLENTYQSELAAATDEYYALQAARVQLENVRLAIAQAQAQVRLNEARLKAGVGTQLEVMQSRSQLVTQEQELINAENTLAKAEQALLNRLNLDSDISLAPPPVQAEPKPLVPMTLTTNDLVAWAEAKNPSLQFIDYEIAALKNEGRAVLSDVVPAVTLQTYINGTGPSLDALGLGRFGGFVVQSNLGENLGLAIPLRYRSARLQVRQRQVQRETQSRNVEKNVINAFLDSRDAAKAILTTREALAVSQESYRLAVGRFRAGLGINLDVLNAENALNTARTDVVRAILIYNRAQVRLLQAIGEASVKNLVQGVSLSARPKMSAKKATP